MRCSFSKKLRVRFASVFLIFAILLVSWSPPSPLVKEAEGIDVFDSAVAALEAIGISWDTVTAGAAVVSAAANSAAASAQSYLALKEGVLDGIAWMLINMMIEQMSRSIVAWINSGFQGSPAFVTDLNRFLLDVADQTMGKFIEELGAGFLCSPFQLDVRFALHLQYQQARNFELGCRLSDVVGNVENFFANNSLGEGGWQSWFTLTTQPANNPYGALVMAQQEASVRLRNARGEEYTLLNFGSGFLSFSTCDDGPLDPDEVCEITTPGAVIQEQLNHSLGLPQDRLVVADEINEILSALFAQLVQQVFTGVGGLLGLTNSYEYQGYTYPSYFDAIAGTSGEVVGYQDNSGDAILGAVEDEENWLTLQNEVITMINNAQLHEQNAFGTTTCSSRELPQSLITARQNAIAASAVAEDTIILLDELQFQYETTADPVEKIEIYDTYLRLQEEGHLHDQIDAAQFEIQVIGHEFSGITQTIKDYKTAVNQDCTAYFDDLDDDDD